MGVPLTTVDAFTDRPFRGNPAAVCLLDGPQQEEWMQCVAAEMNLAETAFVVPNGGEFHLRWFTPVAEVALCGHATLASAHVLWETGRLARTAEARFHTKSGLLTAAMVDNGITLDFPATPPEPAAAPAGLLPALRLDFPSVRYVGRSAFDYLVEVADESAVRAIEPDFAALRSVQARGVIVTAAAEATREADFVSRFFAPAVGVNEDPVTGSAHCCLGPYWAERTGRREFTAVQASARGGRLRVALRGDRVDLTGSAVTVLRGELTNCL